MTNVTELGCVPGGGRENRRNCGNSRILTEQVTLIEAYGAVTVNSVVGAHKTADI